MDWIDKKEFDNEISWIKKEEKELIKHMKNDMSNLILKGNREVIMEKKDGYELCMTRESECVLRDPNRFKAGDLDPKDFEEAAMAMLAEAKYNVAQEKVNKTSNIFYTGNLLIWYGVVAAMIVLLSIVGLLICNQSS